MNHHYKDITDKLGEPLWWDENAVPRYVEFSPTEVANIYAQEVALIEIECQNCGTTFQVAFSKNAMQMALTGDPQTLEQEIRTNMIHYGDPPNSGCCMVGATMNSIPRRVLEFWRRGLDPEDKTEDGIVPKDLVWKIMDFRRVPELEVEIQAEWAL